MSSQREFSIKYLERCYTNDLRNIKDLDVDKILVYKKQGQNFFIYHVAHKAPEQ